MPNLSTGLQYTITVNGASAVVDPTKQVMIAGRRTTGGVLYPVPTGSSYSQPSVFQPILLPSFDSGLSAVNFLVNNYGFKVTWGVDFTTDLVAPNSISAPLSDGSILFIWNTIPFGFQKLVNISLTGTVTQNTDTGTIIQGSLQILGTQAQMRVLPIGLSTFNTTDPITINGTNNIQKPNPVSSDEIVVGVFAFYEQATVLPTYNNSRPNAWISVLNDNCTTINPSSTPIALGAPTDAVIETNGSQTLTYPINTVGLGYLPTQKFGATIATQATSAATGTFNGYTFDGLGNVLINIINTTGTFDNTNSVSIVLDVTQSYFNYIANQQINFYAIPFQITTLTDLTVTQSSFYNGILIGNNGYGINDQKYLPTGYYGNILPIGQVYSLGTPNLPYFKGTWKGDQPTLLDYPETAFTIACASAYLDANTGVPYNSQAQVTLALSVSSDSTTYPSVNGQGSDCNTVANLGWTPIGINSNSQPYVWRNVTSLITIPNTTLTDNEFRFVSVWQKQRWLQQQVYPIWQAVSGNTGNTNGGMVLVTGSVLKDFQTGIQSALTDGQTAGMFANVESYLSQVVVVQNNTDPTQIDIQVPTQVYPELSKAAVNVQLFSIYYNFTSSSAA